MMLITGASSGIGEACARFFAHSGEDLFLVARRQDRLESLAIDLRKTGRNVTVAPLDVRVRADVQTLARSYADLLNTCTVLINNAGLASGMDPIQSGSFEDWDLMIDTNLKGLLYVTEAVLPHFLKNKKGHIVNLGSVAGRWAYPKGNVYSATKRAVGALTESMRLDLIGTGIRVTEICPGLAETEFSQVRLKDLHKAKAVYQGMIPLSAEDIAETIAWCVSRPAHVNIQELVIYPTDQASPTSVSRKLLP